MKKSILIIANGHLCRNPRVMKEAMSLGNADYDVTVLTVSNHPSSEKIDRTLVSQAPFRRVILDQLDSSFFGILRIRYERFRVWISRGLYRSLGFQTPQAFGPARELLKKALNHPADLTIVHTEVPFWIGTQLMKMGRVVAADFEDWHSEDLLPDARANRPIELLREIEKQLARKAVYTTTTSTALARAIQARFGGRLPIVVSNSFELQNAPLPKENNPPRLFWFSQTIGPGRGLEEFIAAWILTQAQSELVLLGEVDPDYRASLVGRLPSDFGQRIHFRALVPPAQLPSVIAEHDFGLALEQSVIPNRDLTITNKILQYLDAGLAVIATPTTGQQEALSNAPGAGVFVNLADSAKVAIELDALIASPARIAACKLAARAAAESTYNWTKDSATLLDAVNKALDKV